MDIRAYFRKVRQAEESIATPWVVVVTEETPDGGKPGTKNEVSREVAAQLIVEGRARVATEAEANEHRAEIERARTAAEQERMAGKMQIAVMSEENVRALKSSIRQKG
jgi:hypothetical protein